MDALTRRERLREMIRAELAKENPVEVARSSLELLAETSLVSAEGDQRPEQEAVRKAVAELREKHPKLFRDTTEAEAAPAEEAATPEPAPPLAQQPKPERDWLRVEGENTPAPPEKSAALVATPLPSCEAPANALGNRLADKARELTPPSPVDPAPPMLLGPDRPTPPSRYVYAGLAAVVALGVFGWVWSGPSPAPKPAKAPVAESAGAPAAQAAKPAAAKAPIAQAQKPPASPAPAEPSGTGSVPDAPAAAAATPAASSEPIGALTGVPEVVDTATLRIGGRIARLFGVEWARGGQGEDLARYLRGREVLCELAKTPDIYRCKVEAQDLSKVILFNGGGKATADATPELAAAENHAKTERLGIWRR
ncbi:MAG: hypothetical protein K0S06_4334 [Microvirga sp.]|nr:hypothetical protein [Microvirga sp.]